MKITFEKIICKERSTHPKSGAVENSVFKLENSWWTVARLRIHSPSLAIPTQ